MVAFIGSQRRQNNLDTALDEIEVDACGHPAVWRYQVTDQTAGGAWVRTTIAEIYALLSGRIIACRLADESCLRGCFGPGYQTLAMQCDGAPSIGRIVHVWSMAKLPPTPAVIFEVFDDGSVITNAYPNTQIAYRRPRTIGLGWTWPVRVPGG